MASKRFNPRGQAPSSAHFMAAFIGDLLAGTITATTLTETRDGRGRIIRLDYEDPSAAARVASVITSEPVRKRGAKKPRGSA
jgi:hypothetical protein